MRHAETYDKKKLGELLRDARLAKGVTLKVLGDALGVYLSYVSDVEAARTTISPERLDQLAVALGVNRAAYRELFQTREALPPYVTRHFLTQPWPRRLS